MLLYRLKNAKNLAVTGKKAYTNKWVMFIQFFGSSKRHLWERVKYELYLCGKSMYYFLRRCGLRIISFGGIIHNPSFSITPCP